MKKVRLLFLAAGLGLALSGCDDSDSGSEKNRTITFEEAVLVQSTGGNPNTYSNILWGKEKAVMNEGSLVYDDILYEEEGGLFGTYYTDAGTWDTWAGFAISSNIGKTATADPWDYSNQFNAYADTGSKFAMGYYAGDMEEYTTPTIEFDSKVEMLSVMITNANKTYHYVKDQPKINVTPADPGEDIWVELIITGYSGGTETGMVKVQLAKGETAIANWTLVDLSELGTVNRVTFVIDSNDFNNAGLLVPAFFCLDNLKFRRQDSL